MMEEAKAKAPGLKDHVRGYVQTYAELVKVKLVKSGSTAVSGVAIGVTAFFFAFFFLFFIGFGLAWWVGVMLGNIAAGFFIVAGFFLFLLVLLFALRRKLIVPMIRNAIIRKMYE